MPDELAGYLLARRLDFLRAELVWLGGERWEVRAQVEGSPAMKSLILAVDEWLRAERIGEVTVAIEDRRYTIVDRRAPGDESASPAQDLPQPRLGIEERRG